MNLPFSDNVLVLLIIYAVLSDLATGLGVLPFLFFKKIKEDFVGILSAVAGGMMVGASFIVVIDEGFKLSVFLTLLGILIGSFFVYYTSERFNNHDLKFENLSIKHSKIAFLTFIVLFFHSFPEGIAIGMSFTGDQPLKLGTLMSLSIAMHNIPEGLMIALVLYPRGVSLFKCFIYAVLSSLPQPLAALPSFFIGKYLVWTVPLGFGFAAGAMIHLTVAEILPESFEKSNKNAVSFGFVAGLILIVILVKLIG